MAKWAARRRWPQASSASNDLAAGHDTFLEVNAAENRAELFAYSTECYFEQPHDLAEFHPDLFDCLLSFYKTDPRSWFGENGGT
jgi:Mlc titration factor MtfA (ptsG expression regulator)